MAMSRMTISLSEADIENFEAGRDNAGMSKSAFLRLLIAEHEDRVPYFIKYKDVIDKFSDLNKIEELRKEIRAKM